VSGIGGRGRGDGTPLLVTLTGDFVQAICACRELFVHDGNEGLALLDRVADGSHEVTAGSDSLFIHPDIISCVGRAGKAHEAG
jgi:hypothetical protein